MWKSKKKYSFFFHDFNRAASLVNMYLLSVYDAAHWTCEATSFTWFISSFLSIFSFIWWLKKKIYFLPICHQIRSSQAKAHSQTISLRNSERELDILCTYSSGLANILHHHKCTSLHHQEASRAVKSTKPTSCHSPTLHSPIFVAALLLLCSRGCVLYSHLKENT